MAENSRKRKLLNIGVEDDVDAEDGADDEVWQTEAERKTARGNAVSCKEQTTAITDKARKTNYCVKYEDNNSKRWDGKVVVVDGEWLHSVCEKSEIQCGTKVKLPWTKKGGTVQLWNAVIVEDLAKDSVSKPSAPNPSAPQLSEPKPKSKQKRKGEW